jgi:hypothetical protein
LSDCARRPSEEEWGRLLESAAASMAEHFEQAAEAQEFVAAVSSRRPVVTLTLGAVILAVFGLEYLFGGTQSAAVLMRMGDAPPGQPPNVTVGDLLSDPGAAIVEAFPGDFTAEAVLQSVRVLEGRQLRLRSDD